MTIKEYIEQYKPSFKIGNIEFIAFFYGEGNEDIEELFPYDGDGSMLSFLRRLRRAEDEITDLCNCNLLYRELYRGWTSCDSNTSPLNWCHVYVGEEGMSNIYKDGKFVDKIYFEVRLD